MHNKATLLNLIHSNQTQLKAFGIKKLGLFGSFARNQASTESDIDLLIFFEKGEKKLENLLGAHEYLEKLFGRKTELITEDSLTESFKKLIRKDIEYVGF
jgi:predicted nucleotidyltransferase